MKPLSLNMVQGLRSTFCHSSSLKFQGLTNPYSCSNHILIIAVDSLILLTILSVFILKWITSKHASPSRSGHFNPVMYVSVICNGILGLAGFGLGIWMMIDQYGRYQTIFPLHGWLAIILQGLTWLLLNLVLYLKRLLHPCFALVKVCLILTIFSSGFLCVSSLWEASAKQNVSMLLVLEILSFPGAILFLYANIKGQTYTDVSAGVADDVSYEAVPGQEPEAKVTSQMQSNVRTSPFADAGFLSQLSFWWLNPLIKKGKRKVLEDEDIPQLRNADQAKSCYLMYVEKLRRQQGRGSIDSISMLSIIISWQWREIMVSGFFALISVISLSTGPLFLKAFIGVASGKATFQYEGYALTLGLFLAKCLESLSERQWRFRTRLIGIQVRSMLSAAIYQKQLRLSNAAKITHSPGEIVSYVIADAYRIGEFPYWFHQIWTTSIQLSLALAIVYYSIGIATCVALISIILIVIASYPLLTSQQYYQKQVMLAADRRLKAITEALANMKVLKLYAWETHFRNMIEELRKEEFQWISRVLTVRGYNVVLYWTSGVLVPAITFWACYILGIPLSASSAFTFLASLRIVQEPIRAIPEVAGVYIEAKVSLDRIVEFLDAPELQNRTSMEKCSSTEIGNSILVRSAEIFWRTDPSSKPALRNINFEVKPGEKVAICGEVGSGKSTLLAAILGEAPKISGTVQVCGSIAYVSQAAWIQQGTIQENILFGSVMDPLRYNEVLERCSLVKDLEMLPFGDLTEIGERGVNLSGGQKQRLQLARALYRNADVYLLDDPFSAVDAHTATSLLNEYVLKALSEKTVLLVTHQLDFLPAFSSILLMSAGEIIKTGSYDQLLDSSQEFRDLVKAHEETFFEEREGDISTEKIATRAGEIQKVYVVEQTKAPLGDQLITKEVRETGDTGFKPYMQYISHKRGFIHFSLSSLFHLFFILGQLTQNYWLAAEIQNPRFSRGKLLIVYAALGCFVSIFLLLRCFHVVLLGCGASESIFSSLVISLFRAPMSFYDSTPLGRILSRISSDLSIIDLEIAFRLAYGIGNTMNTYLSFAVLAILTWPVLFVIIPTIYFSMLLQRYYLASAKELMRINGTTLSSVASHLAESIAGVMTIRAFGEEERFFSKNLELIDKNARFVGMELSIGLSLNVFLVYCVNYQCLIGNSIISVERVEQFMHIPSEAPEVVESNRPYPQWPAIGKVEICNLKVRYRSDAPLVLKGITCTIEGGQKVGIVGRTGSGKTTLVSALFRLVEPTEGKILIDGLDISMIGLHDLRSHFAVIPQDPTLFIGSVRYNLDPLSKHTDQEIWEVLAKCHLKETIQDKEDGLDSLVAQDGSNWSMGQRQLFCMGRALLKRSRILVLDEATASIDNATDSIIQQTIRTEFAECTVITVAHRIPTVMDCNLVLSMSDGKLVECDEPSKLMSREGSLFGKLVKEYWSRSTN
ncbi:hypothetical protein Tsubulata_002121 [Turnera subulata]|uniref:ABC-type xenobiotic transporter n=1 Tax=Turnera subulata TaxID=218843 RepID=A0A9Q0FIZ2_9ROSI|nr:hypothetical protein Tsubulata_002121 [Turnera subulata]